MSVDCEQVASVSTIRAHHSTQPMNPSNPCYSSNSHIHLILTPPGNAYWWISKSTDKLSTLSPSTVFNNLLPHSRHHQKYSTKNHVGTHFQSTKPGPPFCVSLINSHLSVSLLFLPLLAHSFTFFGLKCTCSSSFLNLRIIFESSLFSD